MWGLNKELELLMWHITDKLTEEEEEDDEGQLTV